MFPTCTIKASTTAAIIAVFALFSSHSNKKTPPFGLIISALEKEYPSLVTNCVLNKEEDDCLDIHITPGTLTISIAAIVLCVWAGIKYLVKKNVDQYFNKSLEEYRTELQGFLENKKFDFQRMIHDFSLYRNKKHETYPELYKLLIEAIYGLQNLRNNWQFPDFSLYTKNLIVKYMEEKGVEQEKINNISDRWDEIKPVEELKYELKMFEWRKVQKDFSIANEYFLRSELFLSEEIALLMRQITQDGDVILKNLAMEILILTYRIEPEEILYNPKEETEILHSRVKDYCEKLKNELKRELAIAEYNLAP